MIDVLEAHEAVPRVLMVANETTSGSWQWRVKWPCDALTQHGFVGDWVADSAFHDLVPWMLAGRYNVVIMSRLNWANRDLATTFASFLHEHGIKWVYGADDNVWGDESTDPERLPADLCVGGHEKIEQDRQARIDDAQQADAILVSTEYLKSVAMRYTDKPIVVIPNLINSIWFEQRVPASTPRQTVTVGWNGSYRPASDLRVLADAWGILSYCFPDVRFAMQGAASSALIGAVPSGRLDRYGWETLAEYSQHMTDVDIMCCYVPSTSEFCLSKSPIKWMEASLAGCATAVSQSVYGTATRHGIDTLQCADDVTAWVNAIATLIRDAQMRHALQRAAAARVRAEFSLESNWTTWLNGLVELKGA